MTTFIDVELWATGYLRSHLPGVYVDARVPSTRRDEMVIVRRDGGRYLDPAREVARLGVRVWAKSELRATELANAVRALLLNAPDGEPVLHVREQSAPVPVADESGQPLRFLVTELTVRVS